jgi:NitT/TauT family transport system substrate-binding protein
MRALFCFFLAGSFLLLAGCGNPKHVEVRIALGSPGTQSISMPTMLAQELGFYKEAGLNVTLIEFQGGAKALESLMGGSADVVSGFYDHTIQMAAEGKQLRAFVAMLNFPGWVLVSPGVTSVEGLRGKTVGVTSLGSSSHMILNYLLARHGMKPEDVSTTSIGSSATAVGAVIHNKVDAAAMTEPAVAMVRKSMPGLHILADTRTAAGVKSVFGTDSYLSTVLYSKAEWVEKNRDTAEKLAGAITSTLAWMRTHSPEEIREKMPAAFRTDALQMDLGVVRTTQGLLSPDGKFTPAAVEAVHKVLSTSLESVRNAKIDLGKTYTNDLIR